MLSLGRIKRKDHLKTGRCLFYLALITIFYSCLSNKTELTASSDYFSFANYFKAESKRLTGEKTGIKKIIHTTNSSEEKLLTTINWDEELKLFADADINKPAWKGLYRIDTINSDGFLKVIYQSLDSILPIKRAEIIFKEMQITEINVDRSFSNFYYQSGLHLKYNPLKGYYIKGMQQVRFSSNQTFEISGTFISG